MQTNFDYLVKTEVFEGPLELLIELCEKRKLLINDISLATVTDDYITKVSEMQARSLPHTTQFVQLAATLLLIKSKSLLPALELSGEEEENISDLENRLCQYQVYRAAGKYLNNIFGLKPMYGAQYVPPSIPIFQPDKWCTSTKLTEAMYEVLQNLPKKEVKPKVQVKPTISLEQMIETLKQRIEKQIKIRFFDIRDQADEHKTVIVGFLAILELFKQGNILVTQLNRFADIELELEEGSTPKYY